MLAEKFCATGRGVSDAMRIDPEICKLRGRDTAERQNFVTRKEIEECFEHRKSGRL